MLEEGKLCELEVAKSHSQRMDFLLAGASCVSPPASTSRRPSDWSRATVEVKNPRAWGGLAPFLKGIADEAQGKMDAKQEKYLSIISDGTGTGYGLVKLAFTRKMNDAYPPSEAMPGYFTDGITSELGKGLATKSGSAIERLKAFVTEKSAFREACARTRITLGGVKISDDIDEARTQIARFLGMTPGRLSDADKLKVEVVISLITQGVGLNPSFDPRNGVPVDRQIKPAFDFEAKDKPDRQEIVIRRNADGDLSFDFNGYRELTSVKVLSDNGTTYTELDVRPLPDDKYNTLAMHHGIGSSMDVRFHLTIGATALDRVVSGGAIKVDDRDVACSGFRMHFAIHDPEEERQNAPIPNPDDRSSNSGKHKNILGRVAGKITSRFHHGSK